jgi:hypothetical protein
MWPFHGKMQVNGKSKINDNQEIIIVYLTVRARNGTLESKIISTFNERKLPRRNQPI